MFCKNCGLKLPDGAKFCAGCGAETGVRQVAPHPAPSVVQSVTAVKPRKKGMGSLMVIVSAFLIFIGLGYMALTVAGETITAQVTGYEQVLIMNNDDSTRDSRRYKLDYQFAVNGKMYNGSVTRIFEGGSHLQKTLQVRYLPFWPHVNSEDGTGRIVAGPVAMGLGVLILALTVRGKR